jgi:hypothetical protein
MYVRFTPKSGQTADSSICPLCAISRLTHRSTNTRYSITSSARASRGRRHIEAERPGGLEVDDQLEPRRLYHGQICGLGAVENLAGVDANLPIRVDEAVLDQLIAAGGDDWNRRGRWREALKDGLVAEPPFKGTRAE